MFFKKISQNAVIFITAFLLEGKSPTLTYKQGRVDAVDLNVTDKFDSNVVDVNTTLLPNLLIATGANSRIESFDKTNYWRLGSESMATWNSNTDLWLNSGSALFCSEKIQTIKFSTTESNATFYGRGTIIVEATKNGGFKFIPLEAKGTISTVKGGTKKIVGGRMLLVLGNPTYYGDAFDIDIMLLLKSSRLINAFPNTIPTFKKIGLAIYIQELKLKGKYDALIGDATTNENLQMWKFGKNNDTPSPLSKKPKSFLKSFFSGD
ncbi:hypothetical protein N9H45_03855 [Opitutales bacterium]|nr:hypothetical protein [Opitutales bacterium]